MRIYLQEGRTIKNAQDAINLLQNGKLAGRLGGKKFVPEWLNSETQTFASLVGATLETFDNNPNTASDEVIQFLIKASFDDPEKWIAVLDGSPDTLTTLSKAFASQWFTKSPEWQNRLQKLILSKTYNQKDWHDLEKDIQDVFTKRAAKKHKTISNNSNLYDVLYEDEEWKLLKIKCFEGDIEAASHMAPFDGYTKARWCTAASPSYYDRYTDGGNKLFVIQFWEDDEYTEAWQLAWGSRDDIQLMDKNDHAHYEFLAANAPKELLEKIVCDNPASKFYRKEKTLKDVFDVVGPAGSVRDYYKTLAGTVVTTDEKGYGRNEFGDVICLPENHSIKTLKVERASNAWNDERWKINGEVCSVRSVSNFKDVESLNISIPEIPLGFAANLPKLKTICIYDSPEVRIDSGAIQNCPNLESIDILTTLIVNKHAITSCEKLATLDFGGVGGIREQWGESDCIDAPIKNILGYPGEDIKYEFRHNLLTSFDSIEKITFEAPRLGKMACAGFKNLVEVEFEDNLKEIDKAAFDDCENLVSVKFPKCDLERDKIKVGTAAFLDCVNLEFVENIENIEGNLKRIFAGCPKMERYINGLQ